MKTETIEGIITRMGFHVPTEAEVQAERDEALAYIRSKWPDAEWAEVRASVREILRAREQERICDECKGSGVAQCDMRRCIGSVFKQDERGHPVYRILFHWCSRKAEAESGKSDFERLLVHSGLTAKQRGQTFDTYNITGLGADVRMAKGMAITAAQEGDWLILTGKRGTGKSHLAAAIAISAMQKGKQAYFCLVPEMLDNLCRGYDEGDHDAQMTFLKEVPCLVLDDLGKQRNTNAGDDFLYQIIDARYRGKRQTIITSNATSKRQLVSWGKPEIFEPILSRMEEMGSWVCIERAEDYRTIIRDTRVKGTAKQGANVA